MKISFKDSTDAVLFATDLALSLKPDLPWTMTITQEKSADCCVTFATEELLDVIVVKTLLSSYKHTIISQENIRDG